MAATGSMFTASSVHLTKLLSDAETGALQLPDFQRSWVWDEERIRSLIASISRGFPVGAVMTLETGGQVDFKPRLVEGAPAASATERPDALLLDGQQRLTSLYQVLVRGELVHTITPRGQKVKRWFYIDIDKALDDRADREDAVVTVPESRQVTRDFGRSVQLDLSTTAAEVQAEMFPVRELLKWDEWQHAYLENADDMRGALRRMQRFHKVVIESFTNYLVPVIELDKLTTKEAVCVVFEKVNTGGKALDAFELITAMFAAEGHELRKDWLGDGQTQGREQRFKQMLKLPSANAGVVAGVGNTDFLQIISLFHSRDLRAAAEAEGKTGRELPAISVKRQSLLDLPLNAYLRYQDLAERGVELAARFLIEQGIFRVYDLPYQSQVVPLAGLLGLLGERAEEPIVRGKLRRWFWSGVFGELYGSSTETRVARDFLEVPVWLDGGPEPATVHDVTFREDRLDSLRSRISAAYKGVNALLMLQGARDIRTGQAFTHTVFFDENVDIHHLFPQDWCRKQGIDRSRFDSIINKSPLTARSNRMIGGAAPSVYLSKLASGDTPIGGETVADRVASHLADAELLRANDFDGFLVDRRRRLVEMVERAIGKPVVRLQASLPPEDFDLELDDEIESETDLRS